VRAISLRSLSLCSAGTLLALALLAIPADGLGASGEGISLEGVGGDRLSESELDAGATVVVVWATWSPRCRDVVPRINALAERFQGRARVVAVVFQEDPASVREFLAGKGLRAPVYIDATGAFSKKHAVTALPGLLVFSGGKAAFRGKLPIDPDPVIERALG